VREPQAQVVLLVRAFEESDRAGEILSPYLRAAATRRALCVTGLAGSPRELTDAIGMRYSETVVRRARLLFDTLKRRVPVVRGLPYLARLGASTTPTVVACGLLLGLSSQAFGPLREIDLLSLPLLLILAWNLVVVVLALARRLGAFGRRSPSTTGLAGRLADLFMRGALWRRLNGRRFRHGVPPRQRPIVARSIVRFGAMWNRLAGELLATRVRRTLHLGAIAIAAGAIVGLHLRGLAGAGSARWDSGILDDRVAHLLLEILLGPASLLTGIPLPDLATLREPGPAGAALPYIHLYALTALLYVALPRTVLALWESVRCAGLAEMSVDLRDAYFRRAFTEWRGATRRVEILCYGFSPPEPTVEALKEALHAYFGARSDVRLHEPLHPGDEPDRIASLESDRRGPWTPARITDESSADAEREISYVVLFDQAQMPQAEIHGAFLAGLRGRIVGRRRLLAVLNRGSRPEGGGAEELAERARAWAAVARGAGLGLVEFDAQHEAGDELLGAMREALWPPAPAAAGVA
jgi:hypothetical protein